jgi:hypothetical protein
MSHPWLSKEFKKKQESPMEHPIKPENKFITVLDVIREMGLEPTDELVMAVENKMRDFYERITGHPPIDGPTIDQLRALWERHN